MPDTTGALLIRHGLVRPEQVAEALALQRREGGSFGEALIRVGAVEEARLAEFYHTRLMIPRVDDDRLLVVSQKVLTLVPLDMVMEFRVLPLDVDGEGTLTLAMADPSDNHAVDEVAFFTDRFVVRAAASESGLRRAIEQHYRVVLPGPGTRARRPAPPAPAPAPRPPASDVDAAPVRGRSTTMPRIAPPDAGKPTREELEEQVVLLTRVKRTDETPLPMPLPMADSGAHLTFPAAPDESDLSPLNDEEPILLTRPKGRRRHDTLPGLHPIAPEPPLVKLRRAQTRDEVAALVLDYVALLTRRAMLFVVRRALLVGHDARGPGIDRDAVHDLAVHLEAPSIFRDVVASRLPYRGPLPMGTANRAFAQVLGGVAGDILVMPISVRDRIIAVLYADGIEGPLPDAALHAATREAGLAYERVILATKTER